MAGRRRWSTGEILDTAAELPRTSDAESFSVRKLAATSALSGRTAAARSKKSSPPD